MSGKERYGTEDVYCPLVRRFNPPCDACMWAIANGKHVVCSVAVQAFCGDGTVGSYVLNYGYGVGDDG